MRLKNQINLLLASWTILVQTLMVWETEISSGIMLQSGFPLNDVKIVSSLEKLSRLSCKLNGECN